MEEEKERVWCVNAHCFKRTKCARYATIETVPADGVYGVVVFIPEKDTGQCAHYEHTTEGDSIFAK